MVVVFEHILGPICVMCLCLCWVQLQGNVEAYGTINDMQARGIDTSKLLGVRRSDVILDGENIEDGSCCE